MTIIIKPITRACDGCKRCCEGWLVTTIYGKKVNIEHPCHFLGTKGCSIYDVRPYDPCKIYTCEWKVDMNLPEWLKPNKANVIVTKRKIGDYEYNAIVPASLLEVSEKVHVWAEEHAKAKSVNTVIYGTVSGITAIYTSDESFKKFLGVTIQNPSFKK
jgi:hypothetical protein